MSEILVILLCFVAGALAGIGSHLMLNWALMQRIYSLECATADLQDKILSEIKKRAVFSHREKKSEDEVLEKILEKAKDAPPAQPWYMNPAMPGRNDKAS